MAGTGVGKFSSTAGSNTDNLTVNFAENMAPSNVNNAARELMGHIRDMYEQLGDGYFEFGDGDKEYTIARVDADTLTIATAADLSTTYFAGRKIRVTDGGANVVEGTIASTSHGSSLQTVNLTGISLASGTPTKVEIGIDTAAFGGKLILDDDGDTFIEAPTDDTIDIHIAGAKDFVFTANTFTAESGSTIAAQALTATSITSTGNIIIPNAGNIGSAGDTDSIAIASDGVVTLTQKLIGTELDISGNVDVDGTTNLDVVDIDGAVDMASTLQVDGAITSSAGATISTADNTSQLTLISTDADAVNGPNLRLKRDSSSPANGDDLGRVVFSGENDASEEINYAEILAEAADITDGEEDGRLVLNMLKAGATTEAIRIQGNTGVIINELSGDIDFRVESNDNDHMLFVDGGNNRVGIGTAPDLGILHIRTADSGAATHTSADELVIENAGHAGISILSATDSTGNIFFLDSGGLTGYIQYDQNTNAFDFGTNGSTRLKIDATGNSMFNTTSVAVAGNAVGVVAGDDGYLAVRRGAGAVVYVNRFTDDGTLIKLHQAGTEEGNIAVSGSTVSYNAFTGGHWSRLADNSKPTILRGTIMDSIDEMCDWYQAVADVAESTDDNGNVTEAHQVKESIPLGDKSVGDAITFTSEGTEYTGKIVKEGDVKHVKSKVSDTAGSKKVYGVFQNWDDADDGLDGDVNDMNIAQVGTYIIRVHKDVTVSAGDLLVSNGDGTAKLQDDDIIRSKTVAKVNSNVKVETYADGSYTVPCTLHC